MRTMHNHSHSTSNIKLAFFLNFIFTILEFIGGVLTNSLAIYSSALHDLGDSFSLGLSWYLDKYSKKGRDKTFSYGYHRFSLLAAVINAVILIGGSLFLLTEAVSRIMKPEHSNAQGMILFALMGVSVNGLAVLRLRKSKSINVQVLLWHLLDDVLSWSAVLIVGISQIFYDIDILDPILSILIILYVLYKVSGNFRKTVSLFLQAVPEGIDIDEIENKLHGIEKVKSVHHTHVWSIDGELHVLTTHLVVDGKASKEDIMEIKCAVQALTKQFDLAHSTVEIEYDDEICRMQGRS
jgi:cobalt-zinc-cadmium efflux system protein